MAEPHLLTSPLSLDRRVLFECSDIRSVLTGCRSCHIEQIVLTRDRLEQRSG